MTILNSLMYLPYLDGEEPCSCKNMGIYYINNEESNHTESVTETMTYTWCRINLTFANV